MGSHQSCQGSDPQQEQAGTKQSFANTTDPIGSGSSSATFLFEKSERAKQAALSEVVGKGSGEPRITLRDSPEIGGLGPEAVFEPPPGWHRPVQTLS